MSEIGPLRESWKITNISNIAITIYDVPALPTLQPGQTIEAMNYTSADILGASDNYRNYLTSQPPKISSSGYQHDHIGLYDVDLTSRPDATLWHSHYGLDILTAGSLSDASSLHTHSDLITNSEAISLIENRIGEDINLDDYVRKDGSINQLSDIISAGDLIENAVSKAHEKDHTLLEHINGDYPFTIENLRTLFDGSNADCLHTHSFYESLDHNDTTNIQGGTTNQYYHLTLDQINNFITLTDGSNADSLHTHSGVGISGDHNDLDGLQGGTSYGITNAPEYYHLDYDQYWALIGGPSVNADEYHTHAFATTADLIPLGEACDSDWTDGLFDWTNSTMTACALDDVNEILNSLAPPPAPDLDDIGRNVTGTTGDLSFDSSNPISEDTYYGVDGIGSLAAVSVDESFAASGDRAGIIDSSTDMSGDLNEDVTAHSYSYPADSFGSANQGTLILELNGVELTSQNIDLTNLSAQDTTTGGTTSGLNVSAAISCEFSNGESFDQFKYRTGSWLIVSSDMRLGWNYVRVIHRNDGDTTTNYIDWAVDGNSTVTSYSGIVFDNLIMTGSAYLSGVEYYTGGTANYDVTISNGQRNTYITGNAISFTGTNGSISSQSFLDTNGNELQDRTLTNLTFTISSDIRLLNENISVYTDVNRTIDANEVSSSSSTISSILMDDLIDHTTTADSSENFDGEGYRLPSNLNITDISYSSGAQGGPVVWDVTKSIADAGDVGYNDGLLVYNSRILYPTQALGALAGDFRDDGDGGSISYAPAGNPDYSGCTGERSYLRYFWDSSTRQNFNFNFTVNNTTFVAASNKGSLSGNQVTVELLAPNTTKNGAGTVEWKDLVMAYTTDSAIGCYAGMYGDTIPTDWGATIGSKSTATSGNAIVLRITASSSWTGYISNITCTFL